MARTKEEIKQAAAARRKKEKRLPSEYYQGRYGPGLHLLFGKEDYFEINGNTSNIRFTGDNKEYFEVQVDLTNIAHLVDFIDGLTRRVNYQIELLNARSGAIEPVKKLTPAKPSQPS